MRALFVAALVASFTMVMPANAQPVRQNLLRVAAAPDGQPVRASRHAVRRRLVEVETTALSVVPMRDGDRAKSERLLGANLFDDVWLPVTLDSLERDLIGSYIFTGRIEGELGSNVTIAVNHGSMTATFSTRDRHFEIRPVHGALHEVVETDLSSYRPELNPREVITSSAQARPNAVVSTDSGSTWDVLVAYTNVARDGEGGDSAIQSLISNAITATNVAYANSGVTPRLRLVGTMMVTYDDTVATFSDTLSRLRLPSDGYMDEVHTRRAQLGADAVELIVWWPSDSACGIGYMMGPPTTSFAPYAFNVVESDCAVGNLSSAHELGHNFGLNHDRGNASGTPSYSYAYGYQNAQGIFRDIMAYANLCPAPCPRVQYFSNPNVLYQGTYPMGVDYQSPSAADNVRALNNNASTIANFVQSVAQVTFTDDPLVAGTTQIKAIHLTELRSAINSVRASVGLAAATWTDPTPSGVTVKAAHITEMRDALTPALTALGRAATFTDSSLAAGFTVKAAHIQELRNYTK